MIKARSVRTAVVGMVFGLMLGLTTNPSASAVAASSSASSGASVAIGTLASPPRAVPKRVKDMRPPSVCLGHPGKFICISKLDQRLYKMYNGRVIESRQNRVGGLASDGTRNVTHNGSFRVYDKIKAKKSTAYHVWMYDVLKFNGAQYIHYSEEFARYGFKYGSHGCVGLRDREFSKRLYVWASIGTRVVVTPN